MADRMLDARTLDCPLPLVEARRLLAGMQPGETLEVLTTIPDAELDFEALCRMNGHALVQHVHRDGVHRLVLRHSG